MYDIKWADYNSLLGSIELLYDLPPSVFVVGGGGTGTRFFVF
ncbi:hypothetical protein [Thermoanaerobacter kivui]|nr:hypothetical protein [Thermoanaerobacter kivui]